MHQIALFSSYGAMMHHTVSCHTLFHYPTVWTGNCRQKCQAVGCFTAFTAFFISWRTMMRKCALDAFAVRWKSINYFYTHFTSLLANNIFRFRSLSLLHFEVFNSHLIFSCLSIRILLLLCLSSNIQSHTLRNTMYIYTPHTSTRTSQRTNNNYFLTPC